MNRKPGIKRKVTMYFALRPSHFVPRTSYFAHQPTTEIPNPKSQIPKKLTNSQTHKLTNSHIHKLTFPINQQPSTINHQPTTINQQPSTNNHQLTSHFVLPISPNNQQPKSQIPNPKFQKNSQTHKLTHSQTNFPNQPSTINHQLTSHFVLLTFKVVNLYQGRTIVTNDNIL